MSVDVNRVRQLLRAFEPDYVAIGRLGPAVLPVLARFISGADQRLAAAATSATRMIRDPGAARLLAQAARSPSARVRLAAAGAAKSLQGPAVNRVIHSLLGDADQGVRKFAIKAAVARPSDAALLARVRSIQARDAAPSNRTLAARALRFAGNRTA